MHSPRQSAPNLCQEKSSHLSGCHTVVLVRSPETSARNMHICTCSLRLNASGAGQLMGGTYGLSTLSSCGLLPPSVLHLSPSSPSSSSSFFLLVKMAVMEGSYTAQVFVCRTKTHCAIAHKSLFAEQRLIALSHTSLCLQNKDSLRYRTQVFVCRTKTHCAIAHKSLFAEQRLIALSHTSLCLQNKDSLRYHTQVFVCRTKTHCAITH